MSYEPVFGGARQATDTSRGLLNNGKPTSGARRLAGAPPEDSMSAGFSKLAC
jgi:hypothetical protein